MFYFENQGIFVVQGKDIQELIQNLGVEGIRIDPKNLLRSRE